MVSVLDVDLGTVMSVRDAIREDIQGQQVLAAAERAAATKFGMEMANKKLTSDVKNVSEVADFNGWKNEATWILYCCLSNDSEALWRAKSILKRTADGPPHKALEKGLRDFLWGRGVGKIQDQVNYHMVGSLMNLVLRDVDWNELAVNLAKIE